MLDLLKENLSCLDQRPQHYQTRRSFLRRASVHEVGATDHLLTTVLFNLKVLSLRWIVPFYKYHRLDAFWMLIC
jgi:hypothetical protein